MAFWIIAALLTFAGCLAVLLPVVGNRSAVTRDADHDLSVYQDQLSELDRDLDRGTIDEREAAEARAEIGRRILKLSAEEQRSVSAGRFGKVAATIAVLLVPLASWGVYSMTGSPELSGQPLQARLSKNPAESTIDELVARAEAHLAANPQDGRGWEVLAPIYYRVGRFSESVTAWRNAITLNGQDADRELGLADSLTAASGGVIIADAREAYERALELDPANLKAQFALAAALSQEGRDDDAAVALRTMLEQLPNDSPWQDVVRRALATISGDDSNLIAGDDQSAMIENMVAGLDQRLREQPQDPAGWQRLVHSYTVLGRIADASDALARGIDALGADSEAGKELAAFAAERGVGVKE
ncbi:c-type cytochrome biogenesis protein CcmI [Aquamicrobium zhengzhouense]|uniref:C-type cytochrome biogenesis protein CcmI n=1 Tax=Aquamicrobium zhengzhouense TaxID=2781738 RepID=A0ABS0SBR1_9HYPH|nr:c-type cytochrome biogenesis protein CcmI [Aquamicrobium zhengzhouense]MBI1620742.1 c-type cytochrome biogenesis protein CcmI [Aquamicrobium zhengzhouense]